MSPVYQLSKKKSNFEIDGLDCKTDRYWNIKRCPGMFAPKLAVYNSNSASNKGQMRTDDWLMWSVKGNKTQFPMQPVVAPMGPDPYMEMFGKTTHEKQLEDEDFLLYLKTSKSRIR